MDKASTGSTAQADSTARARVESRENGYREAFVVYFAEGGCVARAARRIGISRDTLYDWMRDHKDILDAVRAEVAESFRDRLLAIMDRSLDVAAKRSASQKATTLDAVRAAEVAQKILALLEGKPTDRTVVSIEDAVLQVVKAREKARDAE